ncbi:hypothetical protein CYMTET_48853 [Cymbomonas tetramitiformis]|uniref:Uncharacterized protein n=1 Tax=Cymbomonas tetramitiformis TaxID=36881 RepID=A0AAE0EWD9_9CHLO|nr:hypothetical protein CYMTET_48853 [Cymbomonas tetramitiformis]
MTAPNQSGGVQDGDPSHLYVVDANDLDVLGWETPFIDEDNICNVEAENDVDTITDSAMQKGDNSSVIMTPEWYYGADDNPLAITISKPPVPAIIPAEANNNLSGIVSHANTASYDNNNDAEHLQERHGAVGHSSLPDPSGITTSLNSNGAGISPISAEKLHLIHEAFLDLAGSFPSQDLLTFLEAGTGIDRLQITRIFLKSYASSEAAPSGRNNTTAGADQIMANLGCARSAAEGVRINVPPCVEVAAHDRTSSDRHHDLGQVHTYHARDGSDDRTQEQDDWDATDAFRPTDLISDEEAPAIYSPEFPSSPERSAMDLGWLLQDIEQQSAAPGRAPLGTPPAEDAHGAAGSSYTIGKYVACVLLEEYSLSTADGVDRLARGVRVGRVVQHIGASHHIDMCEDGCEDMHDFYYVRFPSSFSDRQVLRPCVDLKLDLCEEHRLACWDSLREVAANGEVGRLEDAYILLQGRSGLPPTKSVPPAACDPPASCDSAAARDAAGSGPQSKRHAPAGGSHTLAVTSTPGPGPSRNSEMTFLPLVDQPPPPGRCPNSIEVNGGIQQPRAMEALENDGKGPMEAETPLDDTALQVSHVPDYSRAIPLPATVDSLGNTSTGWRIKRKRA